MKENDNKEKQDKGIGVGGKIAVVGVCGVGAYMLFTKTDIEKIIREGGESIFERVGEYVKETVSEGASSIIENIQETISETFETITETVTILPPTGEGEGQAVTIPNGNGEVPWFKWEFPPWVKPVMQGFLSGTLSFTPWGIDLLAKKAFGLEPWWSRLFGAEKAGADTPAYQSGAVTSPPSRTQYSRMQQVVSYATPYVPKRTRYGQWLKTGDITTATKVTGGGRYTGRRR